MASYVESVLAPGERVVHNAAISHWKFMGSYAVGVFFIAAAGALLFFARQNPDVPPVTAAVPFVIGVIVILVALIRRASTELALTDRRIIAKFGFISRNTVEMNLGKVESLHVNQSLLGRMLGFGDVTVVGTGSSLEPLRGVSDPLELRRKLGEVAASPAQKNA